MRSSVIAFPAEIDEWLLRSPQGGSRNGHDNNMPAAELARVCVRARANRLRAKINRERAVHISQLVRQQYEGLHRAIKQVEAMLSKRS